ncbi:restriction endonuclease subunit S [Cytophaga sp. FL35]|uniref:restriction endonuclease subunit S n=1 Tax=Cytophaga sp. FL35 TaxID=1904456 RepID=UPI001653CC67|nr:restriction endonuclease subunit S [Cytophaga sp. FL35]MBC7000704.1 restriction endonuclease subunit S [Cytophaga sp. FL35]
MENNLPENWIETDLGSVLSRMTNGSSLKQQKELFEGSYPITRIETIWNETIDLTRVRYVKPSKDDIEKYSLRKGDILFSHINSGKHIGKTVVFNLDETVIHGINLLLLRTNSSVNGFFLNYLLTHFRFSGKFMEKAQHSVNQCSINQKKLKEFVIPIPPRPEQDRIVAKVDVLMAQVATMQKSLERIPQLLKDFRQQVLTQAVTGKLTEEWRKGKELGEWRTVTLIELIKAKPRNGFSPKGVDFPTDVKSLSLGATTSGKFNPSKVKYLDIVKPDSDSHLWLKHGDILIQRSNSLEYVGTSALYTGEDNEFIYPDIMMKVQAKKGISNKYLNYCLSSSSTKEYYKSNATGTAGNMPKINQSVVSNTPVSKPPLKEQQEIVHRVECLFAKADAIEEKYQSLKTKIDTLPQAILHKAFKGELVEQLPTDGDAADLLKEISRLKKEKSTVS